MKARNRFIKSVVATAKRHEAQTMPWTTKGRRTADQARVVFSSVRKLSA